MYYKLLKFHQLKNYINIKIILLVEVPLPSSSIKQIDDLVPNLIISAISYISRKKVLLFKCQTSLSPILINILSNGCIISSYAGT